MQLANTQSRCETSFSQETIGLEEKMFIVDYRGDQKSTPFIIQIKNNSGSQFFFTCFLKVPSNAPGDTRELAWFAKQLATSTSGYFTWHQTYDLMWADTGPLAVGKIVRPGQVISSQLNAHNEATLTKKTGAYQFDNVTNGAAGKLTVKTDGTIPNNSVSVGIGMSQQPTAAVQATPNNASIFSPATPPSYSVAFSTSKISKGQVLDLSTLSSATCHIKFPSNQHGAIAELQDGNTWKVTYKADLTI